MMIAVDFKHQMLLVLLIMNLFIGGLASPSSDCEHFLQPEDFARAESMPVNIPTASELDAIQNIELFEGDINGIPTGFRQANSVTDSENSRLLQSALNVASFPGRIWPLGRLPYVMEPGMNTQQRAAIAQAIDEYNRKTCIRVVPREERDRDFVFLRRTGASGCSSFIGRIGGNQTVSLANGCYSRGIVVHELMHALGFFHEQSRPDRDQFVRIAFENISPGTQHNFAMHNRQTIDTLGIPYDYGSVMHYHRTAFSKNGQDTIVPTDRNARIGNRSGMSATDAAKINTLYKC